MFERERTFPTALVSKTSQPQMLSKILYKLIYVREYVPVFDAVYLVNGAFDKHQYCVVM